MSAKTATSYGPVQAPRHLGIPVWKFDALVRHGLVAGPDENGRWSAEDIEDLSDRLDSVLPGIGDQAPLTWAQAAQRLSRQLGLDVIDHDIATLVGLDLLAPARTATGQPAKHGTTALFDAVQVDAVGARHRDLLATIIAERLEWETVSLPLYEAMEMTGKQRHELEWALPIGRHQRFPKAAVQALAAGLDPAEVLGGDREMGADEAATWLRVRRLDFDHVLGAGWISSCGERQVTAKSGRVYPLPVYRAADIDAVNGREGIEWSKAQHPHLWWSTRDASSPFAKFGLPVHHRGAAVHRFAAQLTAEHDNVWFRATYTDQGTWILKWRQKLMPAPDADVRDLIAADPVLAALADRIVLDPNA